MSEQPTAHPPADATDGDVTPKQRWRIRPADPQGRAPDPVPTDVVEGLRTLYG